MNLTAPVVVVEPSCVVCGKPGVSATSKDFRVGKLAVAVSFAEDGKAAGSVPVICRPCQLSVLKKIE